MDEEGTRLYLHGLLEAAFPDVVDVYYRPDGNMILSRPCIVYAPVQLEPSYANSTPYVVGSRFQVTIISDKPGYSNSRAMFSLPGTVVYSNNTFDTQDIVHQVFTILINSI